MTNLIDTTALETCTTTGETGLIIEPGCEAYYSVVIPYPTRGIPTVWHPTSPIGPFSTIVRGAFKTIEEAHQWAADKLEGTEYSIDYREATCGTCDIIDEKDIWAYLRNKPENVAGRAEMFAAKAA